MARCSNKLFTILNIITLLLSIPIIASGVWLSNQSNTKCEYFVGKPVIIVTGVFILLVSLAGIIGSCCRVTWLLWVYLFVMFVLILLLTASTIFALVATNEGAGEKLMMGSGNWNKTMSCLKDIMICQELINDWSNTKVYYLYEKHLSSLESGCCKPSNDCNFQYTSPTNWTKPEGLNSTNPDCSAWNNDPNELCYNCQSCKEGVLHNMKNEWMKAAVSNIVVLIFLIIVFSVGCCALKNNRNDNSYKDTLE